MQRLFMMYLEQLFRISSIDVSFLYVNNDILYALDDNKKG
jgi:hypothetical protein